MIMELKLSKLKKISATFKEELRFPIDCLSIKSPEGWKSFKKMKGSYITPGGREIQLSLRDILLDTGNLTDYCLILGSYKDYFSKEICDNVVYESTVMTGIQGNEIRIEKTRELFQIKIFNTEFESKIGFRWDVDIENFFTVNIGIKSIYQFLNVIFSDKAQFYYFCSNTYSS